MLHPSVTGQGKVREILIATVLAGNDMLNMEGRKRKVLLLEPTIFAAVACAVTDEGADCGIHQHYGRWARMARAFACKRPMNSMAST